ncbi:hypothetical protein MJO28_011652 [Puccinia striiformis f. sp. tritici]|uniref:Protein BIG1 n=5 Tax=Puccinia striiformis TaxID=27350 RepID=A0A0L0UYV0_9BASI|nr:hypothetical protein MJO28_011652 [Puccinia striiformis f. sp. tritici]KAI7946890.1 hypothetical protein MJO29_011417 [Puccinia striiformis f. sp. tritici]KNE92223.1 hypothetical protein PSTG_14393 [Puccinia striiformis f. sp. tritici PST-78]POW01513.1 hypothetical protein PSHT_12498 [Puccinia striiformis]POW08146.1 hypothetical protein PSTT_07753 [Puccinia striiformis]
MDSNFRYTSYAKLFSTLLLLIGLPTNNHAFMQTSPFLAWTNAPGASLQEFLGRGLSEQGISGGGDGDSQLRLDSTSVPLCPSGISSLLIFDLSESEHKSNLKTGYLSPEINHEFNSVPESSKFWTNHFPNNLIDRWNVEIPSIWSSMCLGQVAITQVKNGEDLNSVFHKTIEEIDEPRLVIFTTIPAALEASWTRERRMVIEKRGLPESISENQSTPVTTEGLPGPKTGVFWRYNFLSDYLIVGVLVMLLLFIPPIVLGSFALQSIESPKGLKTKMVGQVSEVRGN